MSVRLNIAPQGYRCDQIGQNGGTCAIIDICLRFLLLGPSQICQDNSYYQEGFQAFPERYHKTGCQINQH